MRKSVWAIVITLLIVLLLVIGAMLFLESRWFSDYLSSTLSERFNRQITWSDSLQIDWSLHPTVRVEQVRVENADWAQYDEMVTVEAAEAKLGLPSLVRGVLPVERLLLTKPVVHLAQSKRYGANWAPFVPEPKKPKKEPLIEPEFGRIIIDDGWLTYDALWRETGIALHIATGNPPEAQRRLIIKGDGQVRGHPIELRVTAEPPQEVADKLTAQMDPDQQPIETEPYLVQGCVQWRNHQAYWLGRTESFTSLDELQVTFDAQGPSANAIAQLFGFATAPEPYRIQGTVSHQGQKWALTDLSGHLGEAEFSGQASYRTAEPRPEIAADLQLSRLNVNQLLPGLLNQQQPGNPSSQQPLNIDNLYQRLSPLRQFDARVNLDINQLQVRDQTLDSLSAEISLEAGHLAIEPLRVVTPHGALKLTAQVNASQKPVTGEVQVRTDSLDVGELLEPYGYADLGTVDGKIQLLLKEGALALADSNLTYRDPASNTVVQARANALTYPDKAPGMQVSLSGNYQGEPLEGQLKSGPIFSVSDSPEPHPTNLQLSLGKTELTAEGSLAQLLNPEKLNLNVQVAGPDPAALQSLLGMDLPHLPSYSIKGNLMREDTSWYLRDIDAHMGESDLAGNLRWDTSNVERPTVWATLYSQQLHLDDFASLLEGGEAQQNQDAIPETPILQEKLQAFDAHIKYDVQRFVAADIPLDELKLDLRLEDGVLKIKPLNFGIGRGTVHTELALDAQSSPVQGKAALEVRRVDIRQLLQPIGLLDQTAGIITGQGTFWFEGQTLDDLAASLDGNLRLLMDSGTIDAVLVEAAGLDLGEILVTLIGEEPDPVNVQCAYIAARAEDGLVDIKPINITTTDSNLLGRGDVNLRIERFTLVIEAHPKDFSLFSASSPIRVYGPFTEPKIDVVSQELIGEGIAAALGAAVFPPAALLALAEAGDAEKRTGCQQMVAAVR
jgi:uncharacterized protein involved in outer membrane biogenesis